ncbi:MAG: hypothetical protein MUP25_03755, partial [Syntrophales bacterium]|nr:hypothetical protein [Syntrophales bacterium]
MPGIRGSPIAFDYSLHRLPPVRGLGIRFKKHDSGPFSQVEAFAVPVKWAAYVLIGQHQADKT